MTAENPFAGQGPVLLDIGGDVGALVVRMPASLEGVEVEIRPADGSSEPDHGHHARGHDHRGHDHEHEHDQHGQDHDQHRHDHDHGHLVHVAVVPRPVGDALVPTLVFPELTEGSYELYQRPNGPVELTVTVTGGEVTSADWPAAS